MNDKVRSVGGRFDRQFYDLEEAICALIMLLKIFTITVGDNHFTSGNSSLEVCTVGPSPVKSEEEAFGGLDDRVGIDEIVDVCILVEGINGCCRSSCRASGVAEYSILIKSNEVVSGVVDLATHLIDPISCCEVIGRFRPGA